MIVVKVAWRGLVQFVLATTFTYTVAAVGLGLFAARRKAGANAVG